MAFELIKVSELPELTTPSDPNVLPIQDGDYLKRISFENLKEAITGDVADDLATEVTARESAVSDEATARGNADAAILADLASAYSASATYAVGDYCTKDGQLYRCTTAISTAEAWTAAHWSAVALGDDTRDLRSALNDIAMITPIEEIISKEDCSATYDETYVNVGSIGSDGKFSSSNSYRTYYYEVTQPFDVYITTTEDPSYYLSLAIFTGSVAKSNFVARYRNSDSNLPTADNRLIIPSGSWVAVSIGYNATYPNRDFALYTGVVADYKVAATSKLMSSIQDGLNGYIEKTATQITIYLGKLKYEVKYYNNSTKREYVWRTNACYIQDKTGNYVTVWKDSDSDGVVKITGEDDFIGGYHGDETSTAFKLLIDGVEYAESSAISGLYFRELMIFVESNVYHCNTSETPNVVAFKRNKIITFNKDGYSVANYWTAQEALSVNVAYMGMLSVQRFIGTSADYLLTGYHDNFHNQYVSADNDTVGSHNITEVVFNTVYGDIGIKVSEMIPPDNTSGMVATYTGSGERLKAYMQVVSSASLGVGDVLRAKATIFASC